MAEVQQVEIVLRDPERRGCSAEIENSTLTKHTDDDYDYVDADEDGDGENNVDDVAYVVFLTFWSG